MRGEKKANEREKEGTSKTENRNESIEQLQTDAFTQTLKKPYLDLSWRRSPIWVISLVGFLPDASKLYINFCGWLRIKLA